MANSTVTRQKRWDCYVDSNPTFAIELRNGIAQKLKGMRGSAAEGGKPNLAAINHEGGERAACALWAGCYAHIRAQEPDSQV